MTYCTEGELLERMGLDGTSSADLLARLNDAITAATVAIDNATGRTFEPLTATKTFAASGAALTVPDLISVTSIKFDDDDDGTYEVTVAATEYELTSRRDGFPFDTVRLLNRCFPAGRRSRNVEITGSWGWSSIPSPINQACSLLAAQISQRPNAALFGVVAAGDVGGTHIAGVKPDPRLVGPYSLPSVA